MINKIFPHLIQLHNEISNKWQHQTIYFHRLWKVQGGFEADSTSLSSCGNTIESTDELELTRTCFIYASNKKPFLSSKQNCLT